MIIYCTETLKDYNELDEERLLHAMGISGWILACSSTINNGVGAKYYFYQEVPNY